MLLILAALIGALSVIPIAPGMYLSIVYRRQIHCCTYVELDLIGSRMPVASIRIHDHGNGLAFIDRYHCFAFQMATTNTIATSHAGQWTAAPYEISKTAVDIVAFVWLACTNITQSSCSWRIPTLLEAALSVIRHSTMTLDGPSRGKLHDCLFEMSLKVLHRFVSNGQRYETQPTYQSEGKTKSVCIH